MRCRRHPSLQESGATTRAWEPTLPLPPLGDAGEQTSCWDLLPPRPPLATIRGGGENTNRGINCLPPPSPHPPPVQPCSIIRQLFIPPSVSSAPSCLVWTLVRKVVPMDSWPSEYMVCIAFILQHPTRRTQAVGVNQRAVAQGTMDRVLPRLREISAQREEQSRVSLRTNLKSTSIATWMRNR